MSAARPLVLVLAAVAAAGLLGLPGTLASWTGSAEVEPGGVTAGRFDLTVAGADPFDASGLSMTGMLPGSSRAVVATVANTGDADAAYVVAAGIAGSGAAAFTSAADSGTGLSLTVRAGMGVSSDGITCAGGQLVGTVALRTTVATGGTPRLLARGAAETICLQVALAATAPGSLQGLSAGGVFALEGVQVGD